MNDERIAENLAAALALVLYDAHPHYSNTAGPAGGIGGQAFTQFCSILRPEVGQDWTQYDLMSEPLRDYLRAHPDFDLEAAKNRVKAQAMEMLP